LKKINIAVDGPAGAGKSTISRFASKELGFIYVDTGALYRAVGLYALRLGIDTKNSDAVKATLTGLLVELKFINGEQKVLLNSEDVSEAIRTPEASMAASDVSAIPAVRDYFYHIFKDPFQSHSSASQILISLTNRPGGNKIVTDQLLLDQLEELVYHLIRAKSIDMAKDIYFNRIGGVTNLGYNLGDFIRLKRLLDEFPSVIDYDGVLEYQRALGLLPDLKEIEAIKSKLSPNVTHRFDSILLLLGELPRAALREVSCANYLRAPLKS